MKIELSSCITSIGQYLARLLISPRSHDSLPARSRKDEQTDGMDTNEHTAKSYRRERIATNYLRPRGHRSCLDLDSVMSLSHISLNQTVLSPERSVRAGRRRPWCLLTPADGANSRWGQRQSGDGRSRGPTGQTSCSGHMFHFVTSAGAF